MSVLEHFDHWDGPDYDDYMELQSEEFIVKSASRHTNVLHCYFCSRGPFQWVRTKYGWRLSEGRGILHKCEEYEQEKATQNPSKTG